MCDPVVGIIGMGQQPLMPCSLLPAVCRLLPTQVASSATPVALITHTNAFILAVFLIVLVLMHIYFQPLPLPYDKLFVPGSLPGTTHAQNAR